MSHYLLQILCLLSVMCEMDFNNYIEGKRGCMSVWGQPSTYLRRPSVFHENFRRIIIAVHEQ